MLSVDKVGKVRRDSVMLNWLKKWLRNWLKEEKEETTLECVVGERLLVMRIVDRCGLGLKAVDISNPNSYIVVMREQCLDQNKFDRIFRRLLGDTKITWVSDKESSIRE